MKSLATCIISGAILLSLHGPVSSHAAEDRRARVLNDRAEMQANSRWIYDDLQKGRDDASRTRKPMLVVFRCIP